VISRHLQGGTEKPGRGRFKNRTPDAPVVAPLTKQHAAA
jgi:hypothetical protein